MSFYNVGGFRILVAAFAVWMLSSAPVWADFIIAGAAEKVEAGSTATVTFSISDAAPYADQLATFQLQLQIIPTMGTTDVLQFSPTAPVYMQVDPYNYPNYVFSGNSFDQSFPPFWSSVSSTVPGGPLDLATGGDFANAGSTAFSATSSYLLATVQIDATNAVVGDTYQIALVPSNSYFQDANGNNINYSGTPADITITPAVSGVPAPSSLVLAGIGSLGGLLYSCWRNRRAALLRCFENV